MAGIMSGAAIDKTGPLPQVAAEDVIALGGGRHAHFRRDRRFAQVQVAFTAPPGIDPNPGRELTDRFKELGWTWRGKEPGKPWIYQLERSCQEDPTARGDSRDALHDQFVDILQEYRQKHGLPPVGAGPGLAESAARAENAHPGQATASFGPGQPALRQEWLPPSTEEETRAGGPGQAMLDAFASVGAQTFDVTWTDADGGKVAFRRSHTPDQLRAAMPAILQAAAERQHNVIVRPRADGATLIQLDDLGEEKAVWLRPLSFLILRTSPGSFQAWIAVADGDAAFARRLRQSAGADLTASGATRVSGSLNVKDKYAPAFPRVETVHASPGLVVTRAELKALGIVALPERARPPATGPSRRRQPRGWPNYQRCLEGAPPARGEERADVSRADFTWSLIALDWGWGVEETAARLMELSVKARENGEAYTLRTARSAAAAIDRRAGRER